MYSEKNKWCSVTEPILRVVTNRTKPRYPVSGVPNRGPPLPFADVLGVWRSTFLRRNYILTVLGDSGFRKRHFQKPGNRKGSCGQSPEWPELSSCNCHYVEEQWDPEMWILQIRSWEIITWSCGTIVSHYIVVMNRTGSLTYMSDYTPKGTEVVGCVVDSSVVRTLSDPLVSVRRFVGWNTEGL